MQARFNDHDSHRSHDERGTNNPTAAIHPANVTVHEPLTGTHSVPPASAAFSGGYFGSASAVHNGCPTQRFESEKPENFHLFPLHHDSSDVTRPTHFMQNAWCSQPSTEQTNQCPGEPQKPQASPALVDRQPLSALDWDLLFSTSSTEAIAEQNHFQQDITVGARTAFTSGEIPFNVLATEDFEKLWSEFHANV